MSRSSWPVVTVLAVSLTTTIGYGQDAAKASSSIGVKGMLVVSKTLARTAVDLFSNPAVIRAAQDDYRKRVGPDFTYVPLVGNRPPPLDYRKK